MNTLFRNNFEMKGRRCDKNIHKSMLIPVYVCQTNKKFFVIIQPKIHVNWNFHIFYGYHFLYNIIATKWKHIIGPNYINTFNEGLEFSTLIIELVNIDESSHEEAIVIFITNEYFNMIEKQYVTYNEDINCFELSYSEKYVYNDPNIFMVSWWVIDSYFNNEQIQIGDTKIMTSAYGSSGSFVSIVGSKFI